MAKKINLNADLGESFGMYSIGNDPEMLNVINSANIACGFHASDPVVMDTTVRNAISRNVSIGAHPSFPDLQGFGRRNMHIPPKEMASMIVYQVGALMGIAKSQNAIVTHVKPHGALYNMAAKDEELAACIAGAVKSIDPNLILMAGAGSKLFDAGINAGLMTAGEIFADRTYEEDGTLTPRSEPGAVIHDPQQSADQILNFLENGKLMTPSGRGIDAEMHSICVHGDSAEALNIAKHLSKCLIDEGYDLCSLPEMEQIFRQNQKAVHN